MAELSAYDHLSDDELAEAAERALEEERQAQLALYRADQALALEHLRAVLADVLHDGQGSSDGGST